MRRQAELALMAHKPMNTWNHQQLKEARKDSIPDALEEVWPCRHYDSGILASRTARISVLLSHQFSVIYGNLLLQA